MLNLKAFIFVVLMGFVSGCSALKCNPEKLKTGYALPGTNTVVIGISLDEKGVPKESYKDIVLYPGQKALFAGPDEFAIIFKNRKTPNGRVENKSSKGVVVIEIPKDILERKEYEEEFRKNNQLVFDYGIRVNGVELDPPMIIKRN